MEEQLELLSNIKQVEAPDDLFEKITLKYQQQKESTVSLLWVRSIAAIFLCVFSLEIYLFSQSMHQKKEQYQSLVQIPDNTMYHE